MLALAVFGSATASLAVVGAMQREEQRSAATDHGPGGTLGASLVSPPVPDLSANLVQLHQPPSSSAIMSVREPQRPTARPDAPAEPSARVGQPGQRLRWPSSQVGTSRATNSVHVCFCTDDQDLRPLVVAINSTMANARDPGRLVFHLITKAETAGAFVSAIKGALPTAQIRAHHNDTIEEHIREVVTFRKSSGARKSLASPFNFAPFYLDAFLASQVSDEERQQGLPSRLVYLDTDVVLTGDIAKLHEFDMHGHAVAAVQDCLQTFDTYIDFKELEKVEPTLRIDPKTCVFNRGVFVVDVKRWRDLKLTKDIEHWMDRYRHSKKDLYKFGMSQPPWLLALRGRYQTLGAEWNCRGLGRELLDPRELAELKVQGFDKASVKRLGIKPAGPRARPYLATCGASSELLHFNGGMKPWRRDKWGKRLASLCTVPRRSKVAYSGEMMEVGSAKVAECWRIWWTYLSPAAAPPLDLRGAAAEASRLL